MTTIGTVSYGLGLYPDSSYQTEVKIDAIEVLDDGNVVGVAFTVTVTKGVADLRGLFFDVAGTTITPAAEDDTEPFNFNINSEQETVGRVYDSIGNELNWNVTQIAAGENAVNNLKGGLNINGEAQNQGDIEDQDFYDMGVEFGTSGIGQGDDIGISQFFVSGITLQDLDNQYFAIRLTSTDAVDEVVDRKGSLKLVGVFDTGGGGEDPVYEGLSPGYWKNWSPDPTGNQVNDWNRDSIIFNTQRLAVSRGEDEGYRTFENIFGINYDCWLIGPRQKSSDVTLLQALQLGGDLKDGDLKKNALAKQATAALLNSIENQDGIPNESDPNGDVNYRFDTDSIVNWTKLALTATNADSSVPDWENVSAMVSVMNIPGVDASTWTTQQATIFGLADLFAQNNNLGVYG
jgi:hypothetical protein